MEENNSFNNMENNPTNMVNETPTETFQINEEEPNNAVDPAVVTPEQINFSKPKKNFLKPILVVVAILVVFIIGFLLMTKKGTKKVEKATQTFENSINKQVTKLNEMVGTIKALDTANQMLNEKGSGTFHLSFKTNIPELEELSSLKYQFDIAVDKKEKKVGLSAVIEDQIGNKLEPQFQIYEDNAYLNLGKVFDKIILIDSISKDDLNVIFNDSKQSQLQTEKLDVSNDEIKNLIDVIGKSLTKSIKEEDVKVEQNITKDVDGTNLKLNKLSYLLNKERFENIRVNLVNDLENDSKSMTTLKKLGINVIEQLKVPIDNFTDILVDLYVNNAGELIVLDLLENDNQELILTYINDENKYIIEKFSQSTDFDTGEHIKTSFKLKYFDENVKRIILEIVEGGKTTKIELRVTDKSSNDVYAKDNTLTFVTDKDDKQLNLEVNLNYVITNNYNMKPFDQNNIKKESELTENDYSNIFNNLTKNNIFNTLDKITDGLLSKQKEMLITNKKCASATSCHPCDDIMQTCRCTYKNEKGFSERIICPKR